MHLHPQEIENSLFQCPFSACKELLGAFRLPIEEIPRKFSSKLFLENKAMTGFDYARFFFPGESFMA